MISYLYQFEMTKYEYEYKINRNVQISGFKYVFIFKKHKSFHRSFSNIWPYRSCLYGNTKNDMQAQDRMKNGF